MTPNLSEELAKLALDPFALSPSKGFFSWLADPFDRFARLARIIHEGA
jgi:hypothetical protein